MEEVEVRDLTVRTRDQESAVFVRRSKDTVIVCRHMKMMYEYNHCVSLGSVHVVECHQGHCKHYGQTAEVLPALDSRPLKIIPGGHYRSSSSLQQDSKFL